MLGQIFAVTISVANLAPMEKAYTDYLGYKTLARGQVTAPMAKAWGAQKVAGHDFVIMQPESGSPHYLRFVKTAPYPAFRSMTTYGWNAAELLVKDPDALALKLKDSPFQIAGPPRPLSADGKTRAMQVIGPANELIYLTNPSGAQNQASSFVDRFFVVINGAADLNQLSSFYQDKMGSTVGKPNPARITVLNRAFGFDIETRHPMAVARLGASPVAVELDQFPKEVQPRSARRGDLPPGISIVSFEVEDLKAVTEAFIQAPVKLTVPPYNGRRVAVIKGPSAELMELVETGKK